ncbi:hypothetical protein ACSFBX_13455 [Variovorax sp. RB2P76]|uniref:hypothetical protein n=1 Tax=Variovorax sp. RB2P76 TaxID=3443736 RepID=UPI003F4522A1
MRALHKAILVSAAIGSLTSCGVIPPQVEYTEYQPSSAATPGFPFRHRRSVLLVKYDPKLSTFKVEPSPYELDPSGNFLPILKIRGIDDARAATQLKVSYVDNTKLLDQVTVSTKDNVADTINKIGTVAAALVPLIATAVAETSGKAAVSFKDSVIDPVEAGADKWVQDDVNPAYCFRLRQTSTEQSITLNSYISARSGNKAADFPAAACTTAIVDIAQCKSPNSVAAGDIVASPRVVYASADMVTPIALPSTGSIKMGSACGASVTEADNQSRVDIAAYLQALITQVNNIKAAAKKKP